MTLDEVADLRRRLTEAEETLRAIRAGEVDALVVEDTAETPEVFNIGGDADSYRTFMEVMEIGAAALDDAGRILYANAALSKFLDASLTQVQGESFSTLFDTTVSEAIDALIARDVSATRSTQIKIVRNGEDHHFIVATRAMRIGTVRGHAVTFTDVTDRVRAEIAVQSERAARAVIASANEAVLVCDRDGIITHANAAASIVYDGDPVGQRFAEAVPLILPGATGLMQADDIVAMAMQGVAVQGIEATAPNAPKVKDYLVSAAPLQVDDVISGCVITMVDVTQRKAYEKQQLLLMKELDHRVKNTLALVLSISSRTLHFEDTLEGFQKSFTGRIQALAATHTLLAEKSWTDLKLEDIVRSEVAPYIGQAGRLLTHGLEISVAPRAAIAFGLVIHELTTNAVKYGALSNTTGHVEVRARNHPRGEDEALIVEWRELDGPPVAPPTRRGFGQTVISRSLQYSPQGGAELDYAETGVVCRISLPAEDMR